MLPIQRDIEDRQAIKAMFEHYFKRDAAKLKHTPLETQVAGDWAYEGGNITENVTPKSGKPIEESIKYLVTLRREPDGSWKVYRDISINNLKELT